MALTLRGVKGAQLTWDELDANFQGLSTGGFMSPSFNLPGSLSTVGNANIGGDLFAINGTFSGAVSGTNLSGTNTGDQDLSGKVSTSVTVNGHALSGNINVTFLDLPDTPASYTGQGTKVVAVAAGETTLEFVTLNLTTDLLSLTDTPNSYSGQAGKLVSVKGTEDGVEFINAPTYQWLCFAAGDQTAGITAGTGKFYWRMPACTVLAVRASLVTASTSGLVTFDINETAVSILGANKLSIDANEKTSTTAATPTSISDATIADDAEMSIDIDTAGTGAKGWAIYLKVQWI